MTTTNRAHDLRGRIFMFLLALTALVTLAQLVTRSSRPGIDPDFNGSFSLGSFSIEMTPAFGNTHPAAAIIAQKASSPPAIGGIIEIYVSSYDPMRPLAQQRREIARFTLDADEILNHIDPADLLDAIGEPGAREHFGWGDH